MTPEERRDMVRKLAEHRNVLLAIVDEHDDVWFALRAKEGDRTRKGMLKHLAQAEESYVWNWALRARDEGGPSLGHGGVLTDVPLFEDALQMSLADLRALLDHRRERTIAFIAETGDDEMERPIHDTPFGTLTVKQCIKSMYRHDRMHVDEMLGRDQTYDIRTRDGTQV